MVYLGVNLIDGSKKTTDKATLGLAKAKADPKKQEAWRRPWSESQKKKAPPKKTPPKKSPPRTTSSSRSSGSSGSSAPKKSADKAQVRSLQKLLKTGFAEARDTKLGNINRVYTKQDAELLKNYRQRLGTLEDSRDDNLQAMADSSFANLANRNREVGDILDQSAAQGLGETDALRARLMALRNFDSNQDDVNRSFYDTQRSVNTGIVELGADTRNARVNLASEKLSDEEQVWQNYQNQRVEAYTALGNIRANPNSDSYDANAKDYDSMAKAASKAWKSPGLSSKITGWEGEKPKDVRLNNSRTNGVQQIDDIKRPEGSTLGKW